MEKNLHISDSSKTPLLGSPDNYRDREVYILHLADNALILSQRNAEWCAHGPVLEQDIAITNISLDLIGQARNFYQYAAQIINGNRIKKSPKAPSPPDSYRDGESLYRFFGRVGGEVSEDILAYLRSENEFKNCLLVEIPKGDWAQTILRQFFFSTYQFYLYTELQKSNDAQLAAIAEKSLKEVAYHLRWSSEWAIRLGDGTEESHQRMLNAIESLWMYTGELFQPATYEVDVAKKGIGVDLILLKQKWEEKVKEVFTEAILPYPTNAIYQSGGKEGKHTEHLGHILADMQYMQRTYPDSEW